jgi:hypothetical protein
MNATVLSQALGLVLFVALVVILAAGRVLIRRMRRDRLYRAAGRPIPGRISPLDAAEIADTAEWLLEMRRDVPSTQPHDPGEVRPPAPVPSVHYSERAS